MKAIKLLLGLYIVFSINVTVSYSQIEILKTDIWKNVGYQGDIPDITTNIINVKNKGAKGDSVTNDFNAIQAAIDGATAPAVIFFPDGNYIIQSQLTLKSGIVLRGEGYKTTHLHFNSTDGCITINGTAGAYVDIKSGLEKGSNKLVVANASSFVVGQGGEIRQGNAFPTTLTSWVEQFSIGQMVKIVAKNGDTLTIEPALHFDYKSNPPLIAENGPEIAPVRYVEQVGIEDLHIRRVDNSASSSNLNINRAANCWIRRVESDYTLKYHFSITRSLYLEIRENYLHEAKDRGDGGQGYGVSLASYVTSTLVEDNIFYILRHSMIVQIGVNGCVIGYNYAERNYSQDGWDKPAISIHGHFSHYNLYEGNIVGWIGVGDYWGPDGPGHTVFRNRVMGTNGGDNFGAFGTRHGVELKDFKGTQYIIGNEIVNGSIYYNYNNTVTDLELADAVVHGNNTKGIISWDPDIADHTLPSSLYRDVKPEFFGTLPWPAFGGDNIIGVNKIPALIRREKGEYISVKNFKTFKYVSACEGESYKIGNKIFTSSGNYSDTLKAATGQDSIIITQIMFYPNQLVVKKYSVCEGDSVFAAGKYQKTTATYYDSLQTFRSCDSVTAINLQVNPRYKAIKEITIGIGESYFAEGKLQTSSGIYYDHYATDAGCDSIIITKLSVGTSSIKQYKDNIDIQILPNPSSSIFKLYSSKLSDIKTIKVYDSAGELLISQRYPGKYSSNNYYIIDLSMFPSNIYFLELFYGVDKIVRKLIKQE
jgi:hypothetical protein